jgi:hypothetical protein
LTAKERKEFEAVVSRYIHFLPGDADALTRLAIAYAGFKVAEAEVRKHPTVTVQKFNRSTGNVTGTVEKRNTAAFANLNAFARQITALERNLLIGPTYDAKRQAMLTKRARAAQGIEADDAENNAIEAAITADVLAAEMEQLESEYGPGYFPAEQLERMALDHLRNSYPIFLRPESGPVKETQSYREDFPWLPAAYLDAIGAEHIPPEELQRRQQEQAVHEQLSDADPSWLQ